MSQTACWVRVPGSTSNLGPGFDVLGLALDVFLEARLERSGTLAGVAGDPADDLCVRALRRTLGREPPPGRLLVDSGIPVGKGLGSSAAARVAGHLLGRLLAGKAVDRRDAVRDAWGDWWRRGVEQAPSGSPRFR